MAKFNKLCQNYFLAWHTQYNYLYYFCKVSESFSESSIPVYVFCAKWESVQFRNHTFISVEKMWNSVFHWAGKICSSKFCFWNSIITQMLLFSFWFYRRFHLSSRFFCFIGEKNMTVIQLTHRPTLCRKTLNHAFYVNRSSGESMTEILFPSRLSNVNSYICCIVTKNSCIKKHAIYKESLELWEIKPYCRFGFW